MCYVLLINIISSKKTHIAYKQLRKDKGCKYFDVENYPKALSEIKKIHTITDIRNKF